MAYEIILNFLNQVINQAGRTLIPFWLGVYLMAAPFLGGKGYLSRPFTFIFFKGSLLGILLGPFLNTLSHL